MDAIPIFVSLITTNFALLQCEGAQALYRLSAKGTANTYLTGIVFFEFRQFLAIQPLLKLAKHVYNCTNSLTLPQGDYLDAIVQHLPKLVTPLQRETLPADQAKIAVLFILRTILNLMKKGTTNIIHILFNNYIGYKDTVQQSTADVIRAWVSMQKGVVNDEIAALISQILN